MDDEDDEVDGACEDIKIPVTLEWWQCPGVGSDVVVCRQNGVR